VSTLGVLGESNADTGQTIGVVGYAISPSGYGVEGVNFAPDGGAGVYGAGATGVVGVSNGPGPAGTTHPSVGNPGGSFTGYSAPSGSSLDGTDGVEAYGGAGDPDTNETSWGGVGVAGVGGAGNEDFETDGFGGPGSGGVFAGGTEIVSCGYCGGDGIDALSGQGAGGIINDGFGGNFTGDVNTTGHYLVNGSAELEIDHPLDPANKYLVHASVESSEMMNIYTGNVTTDSEGHATVQLPEWFQVLNTDFRYQLTVIGQFAQAIVAHEIENNRFEIGTSAPNVKVSWQVTGVRQDAYAKAHPLVVEQEKQVRLRGFYTHPELYGAPPEKQIEWARHPHMMKRIQEMQARQLATNRPAAQPATAQSK
jgi:trimeric autotransporter adhesin